MKLLSRHENKTLLMHEGKSALCFKTKVHNDKGKNVPTLRPSQVNRMWLSRSFSGHTFPDRRNKKTNFPTEGEPGFQRIANALSIVWGWVPLLSTDSLEKTFCQNGWGLVCPTFENLPLPCSRVGLNSPSQVRKQKARPLHPFQERHSELQLSLEAGSLASH